MITKDDCMLLVLEKFPNFSNCWADYLIWCGDNTPTVHLGMMEFSSYTVDILNNPEREDEIKHIFAFIEELLINGDNDVQNAAATCFLEGVINGTSRQPSASLKFVNLLGSESKIFCKAWDEFTGVKTEGLWAEGEEFRKRES